MPEIIDRQPQTWNTSKESNPVKTSRMPYLPFAKRFAQNQAKLESKEQTKKQTNEPVNEPGLTRNIKNEQVEQGAHGVHGDQSVRAPRSVYAASRHRRRATASEFYAGAPERSDQNGGYRETPTVVYSRGSRESGYVKLAFDTETPAVFVGTINGQAVRLWLRHGSRGKFFSIKTQAANGADHSVGSANVCISRGYPALFILLNDGPRQWASFKKEVTDDKLALYGLDLERLAQARLDAALERANESHEANETNEVATDCVAG